MSIIVLGTVALDTVKTPFGKRKQMLGGSAVHFAMAARLFCNVNLVAVVGHDFPKRYVTFLEQKGVNLTSLIFNEGKTFQWEGEYRGDLNTALTLSTQLGVLSSFAPTVSDEQRKIKYVFLANIDPDIQRVLLSHMRTPKLVALDSMNPEGLKVLAGQFDAETRAAMLEKLPEVDEEFLERNRNYYTNHMAAIQAVLSSRLPYEETFSQLRRLDDKPKEDLAKDASATLASMVVPVVSKVYGHEIAAKTRSNALRAALELYIAKAETGRLPEGLPSGLPKDLFSGSDFGYEKKGDGFVLRCQSKDLVKDQIHEYKFKVMD